MSAQRRLSRCHRCGYRLIVTREINPPVHSFPRCSNKFCPEKPACPSCGSQGIHRLRTLTGGLRCRACQMTFVPEELEG